MLKLLRAGAMRWLLVIAFLNIHGSINYLAAQPKPALSSEAEQEEPFPPLGIAALDLGLPQHITSDELIRYGDLLSLSKEQGAFLNLAHERYLEKHKELNRTKIGALKKLAITASEVSRDGITRQASAVRDQFHQMQAEILRDTVDLEDQMFNMLSSVLSDVQLTLLPRVQMRRQRARCCFLGFIPASRIDLAQWIEESGFEAEVMVDLDPLMREYESALIPLYVRLDKALRKNAGKIDRDLAYEMYDDAGNRRQEGTPEEAMVRARATTERREHILADGVRLQKRIADLNEQFLPRFLEKLPEPQRSAIETRFLQEAYSRVYPDVLQPGELFSNIMGSELPTKEIQDALVQLHDAFEISYEAISQQMTAEYSRWCEYKAKQHGYAGEDYLPYQEKMRRLRAERWERSEQFVRQIAAILPPEAKTVLQQEFEAYEKLVSSVRQRAEMDNYPSP